MSKQICPECNGKGFTEREAGIIMIECRACKGIGIPVPEEVKIIVEPEVTLELDAVITKGELGIELKSVEVVNAEPIISGAGQPDGVAGSQDTGKPKQPKKRKAKRRSRKKSG